MPSERPQPSAPAMTAAALPPAADLAHSLRQQCLLAAFGVEALKTRDFDTLLRRATELGVEGLEVPLCAAFEVQADRRLLVRAGVGWAAGVVGHAAVEADPSSPAGYALRTGEPVVSNHLDGEQRFRTPALLAAHGVRRAVNVLIAGEGGPFGVLEAGTPRREGRFTPGDVAFLQGLANVLGAALERHWSGSRLRASEERLQLALDASGAVGTWDWDVANDCVHADAPFAHLYGVDPGQAAAGAPIAAFVGSIHPDDRDTAGQAIERAIALAGDYAQEYRLVQPDGSVRWVSARGRSYHDGDGRPARFPGVAVDVTDRRRAEEALRENEQELRLERGLLDEVIRQAPVGISIGFAEIARPAILNDKAVELLGHGQHPGSLERYERYGALHPDGRAYAVQDYPTARALLTGEVVQQEELLYRRGDGSVRRLEVSSAPVRDEAGRIVAAVTVFTDIEDQRRAEAANARLAAIVSASSDAIMSFEAADGRIATWNKGAERLFGYTEAQAVGAPVSLLLPPADGLTADEDETGVFRWALRHGRIEAEVVRRHRDGALIDVSVTAARMEGPGERPIGVSAIFRDIRPRKQAEALLREQVEHQEVLVREVSHRVKNSLAIVASLLGLQGRATKDLEARRLLEAARTRVEMIAQVHDQLWRQEDMKSVDLAVFLGGLCARLQETAPPGHRVVWDLAPIVAPTDQAIPMGLLVNELVTNAFKYAYPAGTAEGEIRVALAPRDDALRLEVADRGVGLPADFNIIEGGSGSLGMRLVRGLARQLGAQLEVAAAEPRGARFTLDVPRQEPA